MPTAPYPTPVAFTNADGTLTAVSAANPLPATGGGGGSTVDRELVVTTYYVKTAFTGASVGDTITGTQILNLTTLPATVDGVIWYNQTTAAALASAPSGANLTLIGSTALTDAQLRATAVPVSAASLPLPAGASTDATLAAASAKLPASLGAKTGATSLSVVPNTDTSFPVLPGFSTTAPWTGTSTNVQAFSSVSVGFSGISGGDSYIVEGSVGGTVWSTLTGIRQDYVTAASVTTDGVYSYPAIGFVRFTKTGSASTPTVNLIAKG